MERKVILWIEDDADPLMGLVKPLKKDGHEIIVARDGGEAIKKIDNKEFEFDLILFDIIIPTGVDGDMGDDLFVGMGLLEKLLIDRKIETPIIVLSVVRDQEMINRMYAMGVKKVLPKGAYLPSKLREDVYNTLNMVK